MIYGILIAWHLVTAASLLCVLAVKSKIFGRHSASFDDTHGED